MSTDEARKENARQTAATLFGVFGLAAYSLLAAFLGPGFTIPVGIIAVVGGAAALIMNGPVGRAVARRIDAGSAGAGLTDQAVAELEDLRARMLEMEERLEFAERLLVRGEDPGRLAPEGERHG